MSHVRILEERPRHVADVREVNLRAFETRAESDLVDRLRARDALLVSLVAALDDSVVGHIAFSEVAVASGPSHLVGGGLGPMAVLPEHQRQQIGSLLVRRGLEACASLGVDFVVVLGHPLFYPRFGFRPASLFGLACKWSVPDDVFMALELSAGALATVGGIVSYAPEFDLA